MVIVLAIAAVVVAGLLAVALVAALVRVDRLTRAQVHGRADVVGAQLDDVRSEVRHEIDRLGRLVAQVGQLSAQRFGQVDSALRMHADVTGKLAASTSRLREALANPQARGRWGERMAEDVLRLAGFVENVNYRKQVTVSGADGSSGRPDFAFDLPKGHVLYMDVKFPLAGYLRYVDATTDPERAEALRAFLRDVRARVKELARRGYSDGDRPSLDYVLLFLPNEQLMGFIHENDADLLDDALRQRVVMCSPLTLFAFLGVVRQAFDNFMIEQTSDEILQLVGAFEGQWRRYVESADKVKRHLEATHAEFERLTTTRDARSSARYAELEALREQRSLPAAEAADGDGPTGDDDSVAPALRVVERRR